MLTIEQCKKILNGNGLNLNDEQVERIRDELYIAANICFDHWQKSQMKTNEENQNENHTDQNSI